MSEQKPLLSLEHIISIGPVFQGGLVIVLTFIITLLSKFLGASDISLWRAATAGIGLFILLNSNILFVRQSGFARYIGTSMLVFLLILIAIIGFTQFLSGLSLQDIYVERMMFFAMTVFYVCGTFLTFAGKSLFKAWGVDETGNKEK